MTSELHSRVSFHLTFFVAAPGFSLLSKKSNCEGKFYGQFGSNEAAQSCHEIIQQEFQVFSTFAVYQQHVNLISKRFHMNYKRSMFPMCRFFGEPVSKTFTSHLKRKSTENTTKLCENLVFKALKSRWLVEGTWVRLISLMFRHLQWNTNTELVLPKQKCWKSDAKSSDSARRSKVFSLNWNINVILHGKRQLCQSQNRQ